MQRCESARSRKKGGQAVSTNITGSRRKATSSLRLWRWGILQGRAFVSTRIGDVISMSEKICANSLDDNEDVKGTQNVSSDNACYTAIFIVGNRPQIDLFFPLQKYMRNFKIIYINLGCCGTRRVETEGYLTSLNIPYISISELLIKKHIDPLLQRINPNIVIVGHDTTFATRSVIQSATYLNIPTLLIQDGIYADSETLCRVNKKTLLDKVGTTWNLLLDTRYSPLDKMEIIMYNIQSIMSPRPFVGRGECTRIAVFGNATKRLLEREGVDSGKIIVTGSPKFDYIFSQSSGEDRFIRQQLGILPDKKIILLITQPFFELGIWTRSQREEYVSQVGMAVEGIEGCQLIIKLRHNWESSRDYNDISRSYGINPVICDNIDLYKLIGISEVVVTVSSTGGLEAIAAEKPLVIFDPFDTPGSSFYNSEYIQFLDNVGDFSSTVFKIISDHRFRKDLIHKQHLFLEDHIFKNDGRAAERIYNQIINMIKG
jgi:hypothetical protein